MILFNAKSKMAQDSYTYEYNGRPVESRIWTTERRHFQWPWNNPKPKFQGHAIIWRWIYDSETVRDIVTMKLDNYLRPSSFDWQSDIEWLSEIFDDTKYRAVSLRQLGQVGLLDQISDKKLSCRRETARYFVSSNISVTRTANCPSCLVQNNLRYRS